MNDFIQLKTHSIYSTGLSLAKIPDIVDFAVNNNMKAIALTDRCTLSGIIDFVKYCYKINTERHEKNISLLKPILGCELYFKTDTELATDNLCLLTFLAKNKIGYKNLIKLVSSASLRNRNIPYLELTDVVKHNEGLIMITSELPEHHLQKFKVIFGKDLYMEIQKNMLEKDTNYKNKVIACSVANDIKLVATNNCFFTTPVQANIPEKLSLIFGNKDEIDSHGGWLLSQEEMNFAFSEVPEAISNICDINEKIELFDIEERSVLPEYHIPDSFETIEDIQKKYTFNNILSEFFDSLYEDSTDLKKERIIEYYQSHKFELYQLKLASDYLRKLVYEGAIDRYGKQLNKIIVDRIETELKLIAQTTFPGYFLVWYDLVQLAKHNDISYGPGRGTAAGSIVLYCLGITKIDPLRYGLLFERFIYSTQSKLPDIDIDVESDKRELLLNLIRDSYGKHKTANIIAYSIFGVSSAFVELCRTESIATTDVLKVRQFLERQYNCKGKCLRDIVSQDREIKELCDNDQRIYNILDMTEQFCGSYRANGVHGCGYSICNVDITDYAPISIGNDNNNIVQFSGFDIEYSGLIKFDFVPTDMLSDMRCICDLIQKKYGISIDIDTIPLDDGKTYALFQKGLTAGVFLFNHLTMKYHLRELNPETFEHLMAINALFRPASFNDIPSYIRRRHGEEQYGTGIKIVDEILHETYGIIVYQEQIMNILQQMGRLSTKDSDRTRQILFFRLKKFSPEEIEAAKKQFIDGAIRNGESERNAIKIWEMMFEYGVYSFIKPHLVCYTIIAFQSAYLKSHYPEEYRSIMTARHPEDAHWFDEEMEEHSFPKRMIVHKAEPADHHERGRSPKNCADKKHKAQDNLTEKKKKPTSK